MRVAAWIVLLFMLGACKGHREFREARKNLKAEKAERKAEREQEETPPAESLIEADAHQMPDSLFFGLSRTACFGTCPRYDLRLYQSGYATYRGHDHVERLGDFEAQYSPALADSIVDHAQRIGFMFLLDSYDNKLVTDLPATVFYLSIDDTPKRIYCRIQCPESLGEFSRKVERLVEELDWQKKN